MFLSHLKKGLVWRTVWFKGMKFGVYVPRKSDF